MDPDGTGGPHAYVDDVAAPQLSAADRHHLARVVRLRGGDPMTVSDGRGSWVAVRYGERLEADGPVVHVEEPTDPITVAFALTKGSRVDDVVRHLTELGVDRIVPFISRRCVVRWDASTARKRHERMLRIAVEAGMQCRRSWLPVVEPATTYAHVVADPAAVVARMGGAPLADSARFVVVGPEGGFDADELSCARVQCSLGRHVLRAETAALTAGALLADRRSSGS
ncbi:MAG: 16S rRNA (uracil(1498)-N(3))-methyltransferase [Actinobacteria bacterium]|nr:16S rRNA (uracil(1498)-N(3))-methyltransferase [Actinomycetota bacterium]